MSDKYGFIIENDFLTILKGIKVQDKLNSQADFLKRRSEFAAMTRDGYSMGQIAKKYNISRQAVSLALKKAAKEGQVVHKSKSGPNDNKNYIIISRKKPPTEKVCIECGKTFLGEKIRKTCSKECLLKNKQKTYGGEWSRVLMLDLVCKGCGKEFKRTRYLNKITELKKKTKNHYCSRSCYCNTTRIEAKLKKNV